MTQARQHDDHPVIFLVDDDEEVLWQLGAELAGRYGADYEVIWLASASEALARLEREGGQVALLVADQWMEEMPGVEFLTRAHELHPTAKRALLVDFADAFSAPPILQAMTLGRIDNFLLKPWVPADDLLHPLVTELLSEWTRAVRGRVPMATIIGEEWQARSHELRDLFDRNAIPYAFITRDCEEAERLVQKHVPGGCELPAVIFHGGKVLSQPSNVDVARAVGVRTTAPEDEFDLAIIGAGPAGLAAAVYAASEGLKVIVIENHAIGGQAGTSSLIRNYLGFPRGLSGASLAERAYRQAWLFGTEFVFMQSAVGIRSAGVNRVVSLSDGSEVTARSVVIATGVAYRRLDVPGTDEFLGTGVFYGAATAEAQAMRDQIVYVVGAGNSAGQAAIHLAKYASKVSVVVRGASLSTSMSEYLIREIERTANMEVLLHTMVRGLGGRHRLEELVLENTATEETISVQADALFILIGAMPHTAWVEAARDEWGFLLTGPDLTTTPTSHWPLERPPLPMETSRPGIFAAGDVRSGSAKRVASAVGEGSGVVSQIHDYLEAEQAQSV